MGKTNKLSAAIISGAVVTFGLWLARQFWVFDMSQEVQGALQTIVTAGAVYLIANKES